MGQNRGIEYDYYSFDRWCAKQTRQPTIEKIAARRANLAVVIRSLPIRSKKRFAYQAIIDGLTREQLRLENDVFDQKLREASRPLDWPDETT